MTLQTVDKESIACVVENFRRLGEAVERFNARRRAIRSSVHNIKSSVHRRCRALGLTATQTRAAITAGLNLFGKRVEPSGSAVGLSSAGLEDGLHELDAIDEGIRIAHKIAGGNGRG